MATTSARPERLRAFSTHLGTAATRSRELIEPSFRAARAFEAQAPRAASSAAILVGAQMAIDQLLALAHAVDQVGDAFAAADRQRTGPVTKVPAGALAKAIEHIAPGLSAGVLRAPLDAAAAQGRKLAGRLVEAFGSADPDAGAARRAIAELDRLRSTDRDAYDEAAAAVIDRLRTEVVHASAQAEGIIALIALLADDARNERRWPPFEALGAAVWGYADLPDLIDELGTSVEGRNALRALLDDAPRLSTETLVHLGDALLLQHDGWSDISQDPRRSIRTDPVALWLAQTHRNDDGVLLRLIADRPGGAVALVAPSVARRTAQLLSMADRGPGQAAWRDCVDQLIATSRAFDPDGTSSVFGRQLLRGALESEPTRTGRAGPELAMAVARIAGHHLDALEVWTRSDAEAEHRLDQALQAVTGNEAAHRTLIAHLMADRRQTMARALHSSFEHRERALDPSVRIQGAMDAAASATDAKAVDTTAYELLQMVVPVAGFLASTAVGGGAQGTVASFLANQGLHRAIDVAEERHVRKGWAEHHSLGRDEVARRQVRLDAWVAIAGDPTLAPQLRRGPKGHLPLGELPLTPAAMERLADWEQSQPKYLQDLVATFCASFEPAGVVPLRSQTFPGKGS